MNNKDQNIIIYETQKILRKDVLPWTIMHENTIIYESKKILRETYLQVQ